VGHTPESQKQKVKPKWSKIMKKNIRASTYKAEKEIVNPTAAEVGEGDKTQKKTGSSK
jgi:hypothetical protein